MALGPVDRETQFWWCGTTTRKVMFSSGFVWVLCCTTVPILIFPQFRSAEDATAAMAFDGIIFINGPLEIRQPKDYGGPEPIGPSTRVPGIISTNVPDSIHKIFVGALSTYLNEEQVMELLNSLGELVVHSHQGTAG